MEVKIQIMQLDGQKQQIDENVRGLPWTIRLSCVCLIVGGALWFSLKWPDVDEKTCQVDEVHEISYGLNRQIDCCSWKVIIGIGQVMMDFWIFFIMIFWIVKNQNIRFPTAIGLLFLVRSFFLTHVKFPYLNHVVWRDPGFITFTVPYDHTRDYFFSGHTSSIVLILCQMVLTRQSKWLIGFVVICTVFMVFMLDVLRVHYTVDIVAAFIYSTYIYKFTNDNLKVVDWIWSVPFMVGKQIKNKICGDASEQQDNQHMRLQQEDIDDNMHKDTDKKGVKSF